MGGFALVCRAGKSLDFPTGKKFTHTQTYACMDGRTYV